MQLFRRSNWIHWLVRLALAQAAADLCADILYGNSQQYLELVHSKTGVEFGDEVVLVWQNPVISQFKFQYRLAPGAARITGAEKAEIFFRLNDGPLVNSTTRTPGTLVYDSRPFSIFSGFRTTTISGLAVPISSWFTWTVLFTGLTADERASLLFYDPPTTGSSPDYF